MSIALQSASSSVTPPPMGLMTEEEFLDRHGSESRVDLVDGIVVRYPMPGSPHGYIGSNLAFELMAFVRKHKLGRVFNNDTLIRIRRNPDRMRGADLIFLSYDKLAADAQVPEGAMTLVPGLVCEVKSPSDSWPEVFVKVDDYLTLGVNVVLVVDPQKLMIHACRKNLPQQSFGEADTLTIPDILPGFAVSVASLFQ